VARANVELTVNAQGAVGPLRSVQQQAGQTQTAVKSLQNAVTGLVGAFSAAQAIRFVFAKTAELETQTRSLQVLTGSVQQAKQIIEELQQLGAVTPFTSTELIDAAKRLQAFGVEGDRVVEVTRRLADASGATGAELQGLVTAYGQVVAKGRLQGEELLQFQERGVGLQQELQKMYKLSGKELQDALSKGRISAEAVEVAIRRLTSAGGKYANGAVAQSDTLAGRFSTLQDGIDQLARRLGQVLTPALKSIFNQAIAAVDAVNQALAAGRGGGFSRSVFGARQALNVGATSQAVDNIAKGIGQINAQKNKTGIQQNLQALQQYQRLLQSVGADDPNASRAVTLQGLILQKIDQNIAAQKELNKQTQAQGKIFDVPPLAAPDGKTGGGTTKKPRESKLGELTRELQLAQDIFAIQGGILSARGAENKALETTRQAQLELRQVTDKMAAVKADKDVPAAEKLQQLAALEYQSKAISQQLGFDLAQQEQEKAKNAADAIQRLVDEQALLQAKLDGNEAEVMLSQQIRDLKKQYPALNEADAKTIIESTNKLREQIAVADQMKQVYADIGSSIKSGVVDAITSAVEGTKTLSEVANNMLRNIANRLLDVAINMALFGAMSGTGTGGGLLGGLFKKRAMGGSVSGGSTYLVGERGPELFTPGRSGGIAPSGSFGASNIVVNVDATGSSVQGDANDSKRLGEAIGVAIRQELIKQKRPGGLLA
jgi:tape measure domain-containing protein